MVKGEGAIITTLSSRAAPVGTLDPDTTRPRRLTGRVRVALDSLEELGEHLAIVRSVSKETAPPVGVEVSEHHDHQTEAVRRYLRLPPLVVQPTLSPAPDPADGLSSVEEWCRLGVLAFLVLDYEAVALVVGVDGQGASRTALTGIADKPWEAILAARRLAEDLVAEIDDVRLVAAVPGPRRDRRGSGT